MVQQNIEGERGRGLRVVGVEDSELEEELGLEEEGDARAKEERRCLVTQ